jgi:hypothetical protein
MRTCPLIAGASPVVPGEENRWHHANRRLQRFTAAVFRLDLYMSTEIYEQRWNLGSTCCVSSGTGVGLTRTLQVS